MISIGGDSAKLKTIQLSTIGVYNDVNCASDDRDVLSILRSLREANALVRFDF